MREENGDKVRKKIWNDVKEFVMEQHDVEKFGNIKKGLPWTQADENLFKEWQKSMNVFSDVAKQSGFPVEDKALRKDYRHKITGAFWAIRLYFYPDGSVQMVHSEIAKSVRILK